MSVNCARAAGKVAIITGGAMGMGEAHARLLAAEGAKVVIGDVAQKEGEAVAADIGTSAIFVPLDVTNEESWVNIVNEAEKSFGPVTTLVNNAGVIDMAPIDEMEESAFRRVVDINLIGQFLGMKVVAQSMKKAGGGAIVNISSAAGMAPLPNMASYVASKYGARGLSKAASIDLAAYNIRVNSVHPGGIATPMTAGAGEPAKQAIKRNGQPREVAAMVLFLISNDSSYCTGSEYVVDGGFLNVVGEVVI